MSLPAATALHELLNSLRDRRGELSVFLQGQRWFRSKAHQLTALDIVDLAPVMDQPLVLLAVVHCRSETLGTSREASPLSDYYFLPLLLEPTQISDVGAGDVILRLEHAAHPAILRDATNDTRAMLHIAEGIRAGVKWSGVSGSFHGTPTALASAIAWPTRRATPLGVEQSNSSVLLDDTLVLKLLRKLESGIHPDLEMLAFLTSQKNHTSAPRLVGSIEYTSPTLSAAAGILQEYVPNDGDGWSYVRRELAHLIHALRVDTAAQSVAPGQAILDLAGELLEDVGRLGAVTAHLHLTLGSQGGGEPFGPDVIDQQDVMMWREAMEARLGHVFALIDRPPMLETLGLSSRSALALQQACRERFAGLSALSDHSILKIRQHGDYHLGQILKRPNGQGFAVLDFEGEPARALSDRRGKGPVLKDLAGMLRSFDYVAEAFVQEDGTLTDPEKRVLRAWEMLASKIFLQDYEAVVRPAMPELLPRDLELTDLLVAFQVDKAVYELGYELNNRPQWVQIPLHALQTLCGLA